MKRLQWEKFRLASLMLLTGLIARDNAQILKFGLPKFLLILEFKTTFQLQAVFLSSVIVN